MYTDNNAVFAIQNVALQHIVLHCAALCCSLHIHSTTTHAYIPQQHTRVSGGACPPDAHLDDVHNIFKKNLTKRGIAHMVVEKNKST